MKEKEKIPEIKVKIGEKTYETNHQEEMKIARETLDHDMMVQASLYSWYAILSVQLESIIGTKKLELDLLHGKLYEKYKEKLIEASGKATEGAIGSQIQQDDDHIAAIVGLNKARENKGIFDAVCRSFEHRREMLTNLGHKIRKEMDGDLIIKK